jgi:hypothetical protein
MVEVIIGTFAAAIVEPIFIHNLNFSTAMMVGISQLHPTIEVGACNSTTHGTSD